MASGNQGKGIHWVNKDIIMREKSHGGMGFRCFESLNIALLMKQIWSIVEGPNLIVSRVLQAKYFKGRSVLDASNKASGSFGWKSIYSVLEIFISGIDRGNSAAVEVEWRCGSSREYSVKEGYHLAYCWKLSRSSHQ